ncbi:V-type ATP synthase subunit E [Pseudoflavonifractor sp.]|jgi:vacuolar-type H+-ATPase subunit E/Vma4|uniref:V-type ATP synthase subunit E n=1 Tax=Pseudoflavonifractor sp. TaxID=1980281 RepID=UPI003D925CA9
MPEFNKKLDHFTSTLLAEATAETDRVLGEVKAQHDASYSAAEDKILAETYHYIRTEVSRIRSEEGRKVSRHMLDNKKALYLRREEIAREVFEAVRDRIVAYSATPEYRKRLTEVARQTVDTLKGAGDIVICLRPEDMDQSDAIAAALDGVKVEFKADNRILMGGLTASSPSLGRRVDATFGTAMEELNGHFAEIFGLSLSDDLTETVE